MSLLLWHLGPTRRSPSKPEVSCKAWEGLFGSKEKRRVMAAVDAFIHNFSSPKSLNAAWRKFETYLLAMRGLGVNPFDLEEWTLAVFITEQAQRGVSSLRKMVQSLAWAERAFGLSLGLKSPLVQAQRSSWAIGAEIRAKKPAVTASMEMVRQMVYLLVEAKSNMMRCWAGSMGCATGGIHWA